MPPSSPDSRRLPTLLAMIMIAGLAACDRGTPVEGGSAPAIPVTTRQLQLQSWSDTVQALGTVKARESITVTAKVSEIVEDVHFDSGDEVEAGAPLVTLSGQQQRAALNEAQAAAEEAERLYKRQSELVQQQLIATSQFDAQRAIRDAARARVAQIRAQLGDRVITAPFPGVLGIRQVSPGALVTPGTAIATLDDTRRVYVDFPVPESQLSHLAVGQRLSGRSEAWPEREFEGIVSTIDARIDAATRAVTVRGDFPNPDRALRPGMLLQITLSRPERQALLVPEISIIQIGNSAYVYRVKADDTVERVEVGVGARRAGLAEVTSGLEIGDRIVVDGTGKLRPGSLIREGAIREGAFGEEAAPEGAVPAGAAAADADVAEEGASKDDSRAAPTATPSNGD
ncbi:efflux RND transporter periplasmic adaptor subunit [Lysobacter chinensis]|uniref:Efflux RND transporter periplasmic adaptor subunit n=1 Tax=Marilutibacter chinensis TaxID=2912247 RepID=A0ABS9HWW6_9GAMM|nr:efflux RND transporter periplasmic adaptor subunit [Lysobacter chinensis]MCF7223381.1 efflux RND transporter periplasmic adaptor subunit [Lysobacter chinensis]